MPTRKSHHKSRHGCIECKARKVKCDEQRPFCSRCVYTKRDCHYFAPFRTNRAIMSSLSTSSPQIPETTTQLPTDLLRSADSRYTPDLLPISLSIEDDGIVSDGLKNKNMELLHHYTTELYYTLSHCKSLDNLFQVVIPKIAFQHRFLLHGILSLSACHLSYSSSADRHRKEYYDLAKQHYASAISLFRPMLEKIDKDNSVPIFAFSVINIYLALCMPPDITPNLDLSDTASAFITHMTNIFRLITGVRDVLRISLQNLEDSLIYPLAQLNRGHAEAFNIDAEIAMLSIESRIRVDISDHSLQADYLEAVESLRRCSPYQSLKSGEPAALLAWPALVSGTFLGEIDQRKPIAMTILAFFGALMHSMRELWWVGQKGRMLVKAVSEALPGGWESMILWAKIFCGIECGTNPKC